MKRLQDGSFFRLVTIHTFDRQTDGRTDRILIARRRLHSMQRGKNDNVERLYTTVFQIQIFQYQNRSTSFQCYCVKYLKHSKVNTESRLTKRYAKILCAYWLLAFYELKTKTRVPHSKSALHQSRAHDMSPRDGRVNFKLVRVLYVLNFVLVAPCTQ